MCIIVIYYNPNPNKNGFRIIFAANRDEYFDRPSLPANFIGKNGDILCGTDLTEGRHGGTWCAISRDSGDFAALLNVPRPKVLEVRPEYKNNHERTIMVISRGSVCFDVLRNRPTDLSRLKPEYPDSRFTLISLSTTHTGGTTLSYYNNLSHQPIMSLGAGIYAFGNSRHPDTSLRPSFEPVQIGTSAPKTTKALSREPARWLKLERARSKMADILSQTFESDPSVIETVDQGFCERLTNRLIDELLRDTTKNLPDPIYESELAGDYGFGREELFQKSSIYVEAFPLTRSSQDEVGSKTSLYGTRCHTVCLMDSLGRVTFTEVSLKMNGGSDSVPTEWITKRYSFVII